MLSPRAVLDVLVLDKDVVVRLAGQVGVALLDRLLAVHRLRPQQLRTVLAAAKDKSIRLDGFATFGKVVIRIAVR